MKCISQLSYKTNQLFSLNRCIIGQKQFTDMIHRLSHLHCINFTEVLFNFDDMKLNPKTRFGIASLNFFHCPNFSYEFLEVILNILSKNKTFKKSLAMIRITSSRNREQFIQGQKQIQYKVIKMGYKHLKIVFH